MKKYFLLIIATFFITGCSCQYDIYVDEAIIKEIVTITSDNNEEINGTFKTDIDKIKNDGVACYIQEYYDGNYKSNTDLYKLDIIDNNGKYGLKSNFEYPSGSYQFSTALNVLLGEHIKIDTTNGYHVIIDDLSPIFNEYSSLKDLTITIISNKKITGNYSLNSNNRYIWGFNKNSYKNATINFVIEGMNNLPVRNDTVTTTNSNITTNNVNDEIEENVTNEKETTGFTEETKKIGSIIIKYLLIALGIFLVIFFIYSGIKMINSNK